MANETKDYKVIIEYLEKSNELKSKRILELEKENSFLRSIIVVHESLGSISDSINDNINRKWDEVKEKVKKEDTFHIDFTINESSTKSFDAAKFAEQLAKTLNRERGIR